MAQKPLDIFQFMNAHHQCTKLAEFYLHWAWELEQVEKFKEAEMTFRTGLELLEKDDPRYDVMENKHRQFQARVMKRMVEKGSEEADSVVEEQRSALGSLRSHGKHHRVGSLRVGSAKKSELPGALPLSGSSGANQRNNPGFQIFQVSVVRFIKFFYSTKKNTSFL